MNDLVWLLIVLVRVSIAVKRHHGHCNYSKEKQLIATVSDSSQFRGLVYYHHGREHGSRQADMVLATSLSEDNYKK